MSVEILSTAAQMYVHLTSSWALADKPARRAASRIWNQIHENGKILKQSRDHNNTILLVICHPVATIDISSRVQNLTTLGSAVPVIGAPKIHDLTWPHPYQGQFIVRRLWLAHSTCTSNLQSLPSVQQCKIYKLRWFNVLMGSPKVSGNITIR